MAWLNDFMKQFYDYDYSNSWEWDTDNLVNYDDYLNPWSSSTYSRDSRSYAPTVHGQLGDNREHYNYTLGIENKPEYKAFTDALLDKDGNFTEMGKVWAHDVDRLIGGNPNGFSSLATFYDENGNIRPTWEVTTKNAHGHTRQTFNDLRDYVNYIRNDHVLGPRHNGFLRKGTRYYWKDNKGGKHYINPELAKRYKELSRQNGLKEQNDPLTTWTDIEIGFDPNNPTSTGVPASGGSAPARGTGRGSIRVGAGDDPDGTGDPNNQGSPFSGLAKHLPGLLEGLRLAGGLYFNNKIYNDKLKGINPNLKQSYHTYRNIVGDEGTKQAYYRRAAQGQTKAARPVTSDQDRQVAYQMEAKRAADELRAQGDLADNAEIKRTSDESNQHAWANTQRDTEVANWNREQLVNTAAAKADLLAQKHAADWSSWNNYSLAQETRLRQKAAQQKAFDQQIKISELQAEMQDDPEVVKAYERLLQVEKENTKEGITDWAAVQNSEAYKTYRKATREAKKRYYEGLRDYLLWAKKGSKIKISTKTTDDLLYKAARDTVTHFRKMSKMSNDSTLKSRERGFKLTPHPKTPKYNTGGVAPFTVFTPAAVGGSQGVSSEFTDGSGALGLKSSSGEKDSSQDKKGKELLDLTKELFNKLDGLPVDVKTVADRMQNFLYRTKVYGKELDTTDIAQQYMQYVAQVASIKHSKDVFEKAKEDAIKNGSMEDFAVTSDGKYIVQYIGEGEQQGKITEVTLEQIKESDGKLNPLTNGNLLSLRAYSPQLSLNKGDYYMNTAVANSTGMEQISKKIKELMEGVKSSESTIEGYTKVQSDKIKSGVEILEKKGQDPLAEAPDGDYQTKYTHKSNAESVQATLSYILKTLPTNMKAVLKMHAYKNGITIESILEDLVTSKLETTDSYTLQAATGKAASNKSGKELEDEIKNNPLLAMQREIGGTYKNYGLITRDGHAKMSVNGTHYSMLNNIKSDMSAQNMLIESGIKGIVDSSYGITFGDQVISPDKLKDIMYDNSDGGIVVTLPCKISNGVKQVNLDILDKFQRAEKAAFEKVRDRTSPRYQEELAKQLKEEHLDSLLDSNGLPNKSMFGQFLVVEAYTSDRIPFEKKDSQFIEKINNPSKELEDRMNNALSTAPKGKASNYGLDVKDHWSLFEMTYDDIYRGNLFIPLNQNPNAAMLAAGQSTTSNQANDLEELYQREMKLQSYNNASNSIQ